MKCKQHPCERGVGVCACCLRERLLALILAQNELSAATDSHHRRRCSDPPPPPLNFPRSVSPYRLSDASLPPRRNIQRFFSTPQVGPVGAAAAVGGVPDDWSGRRRFSLISALFGRRGSGDTEPDRPDTWLGSLIRSRRKKKSRMPDSDSRMAYRDRGMSPAREEESPGSSGYLTESSPAWWRRPSPSPMRRFHGGGVSGFAVCLSPLVRATPGGRRSGADVAVSGELRAMPSSSNRRCSGPSALAPNRSRKLADLGRFK